MKAIVNKDTCIGCGLCASMCPDVYNLDDEEGKAEAIDEEIDESLIDEAMEARDSCPVEAIDIKGD
ncbi:ferredoxin [Clostridium bornimense]|uniref:ferredoxin n=1 Tax=Clostridium bornimense TaxID=1216932 RepID=UPI001C1193A4|nr:ferredoxin [Clostridium bornimense]MBU5315291.1 ferredoxin [Clostridium bornimense]